MTISYLLLATLAALSFYLSSPQQTLLPKTHRQRRPLQITAWASAILATLAAITALGTWAGVFAALSITMLALAAMPFLGAWQQRRRQHVG